MKYDFPVSQLRVRFLNSRLATLFPKYLNVCAVFKSLSESKTFSLIMHHELQKGQDSAYCNYKRQGNNWDLEMKRDRNNNQQNRRKPESLCIKMFPFSSGMSLPPPQGRHLYCCSISLQTDCYTAAGTLNSAAAGAGLMKGDTSAMKKHNLRAFCHINWPTTWRLKAGKQSKRKQLRILEGSIENPPMDLLMKQAKQSQCLPEQATISYFL